MNIFSEMFILLLSMLPFAAATFFPFTSFRPSFTPPPRYSYRPPRTPPNNNLIPLHSPVLGLRILVPREFLGLFNGRQPVRPENNYPRPPFSYNPNQHPPYPHEHRPFSPNAPFSPNGPFPSNGQFPPGDYPERPQLPPFDAAGFIALMRAFYPDMIYRPDPRLPNVFAIRYPQEPTHLPHLPERPSHDYYQEPNQYNPGEFQPNISQYLEPPAAAQNYAPSYNNPSYNNPSRGQPLHNHLIVIR